MFANSKPSKTKPYGAELRNQTVQSLDREKQVIRQVERRRESHSKRFRRPIWTKMSFSGSAWVAFSNLALTGGGLQQLCDVSAERQGKIAMSRKNEVSADIRHTDAMTEVTKKRGHDVSAEEHE